MKAPQTHNLPIYVYHLTATVGLVHDRQVYKINGYQFNDIVIKTNYVLRAGDVVDNSCCYYGNENVEIIPHLQLKNYLNGATSELKYYYGCKIDRLMHSFIDSDDDKYYQNCGRGHCTVYIELSAAKLSEEFRKVEASFGDFSELNKHELARYNSLKNEYIESDKLEYWQKRIPKWCEELSHIGEVPEDLIW